MSHLSAESLHDGLSVGLASVDGRVGKAVSANELGCAWSRGDIHAGTGSHGELLAIRADACIDRSVVELGIGTGRTAACAVDAGRSLSRQTSRAASDQLARLHIHIQNASEIESILESGCKRGSRDECSDGRSCLSYDVRINVDLSVCINVCTDAETDIDRDINGSDGGDAA